MNREEKSQYIEDLSAKLQWMAQHPKRRIDMGKRALASLANRPWNTVVQDYMDLLRIETDQTDLSFAA